MPRQKLGMSKDIGHGLFLKTCLIGDFFRKHRMKKSKSIGAFGEVEGRHGPEKTRIIQRQKIHQTLGTYQNQFAGCPLKFKSAPKILVRVGGNLKNSAKEFSGETKTDIDHI